jgi:hypothetical protein
MLLKGLIKLVLLLFVIFINPFNSFSQFIQDEFPVKDKMIKRFVKPDNFSEENPFEKIWFHNKKLNQTLIFEVNDSYYCIRATLFNNNEISTDIILDYFAKKTSSGNYEAVLVPLPLKGDEINGKFFISNKGVKLGMSKTDLLKLYGKFTESVIEGNYELLMWSFDPDPKFKNEFWYYPIYNNYVVNQTNFYISANFKNDKLVSLRFQYAEPIEF